MSSWRESAIKSLSDNKKTETQHDAAPVVSAAQKKTSSPTVSTENWRESALKSLASFQSTGTGQNKTQSSTQVVFSNYTPGAGLMTKTEYNRKRSTNPSMPIFGSYEYFKVQEETLRPMMDEIAKDTERTNDDYRNWASRYDSGEFELLDNAGLLEEAERLHKKFTWQDSVVAEYQNISAHLEKFETSGVHFDQDGDVDAESGASEARYAKDRKTRIAEADALTFGEFQAGYEGTSHEASKKFETAKQNIHQIAMEAEKEEAYDYYQKHQDNVYDNGLFGRVAGNYRIGRTGIKEASAGYTSYSANSSDLEAAEVYQRLAQRLQKRNEATFANNSKFDENLAIMAQYIPQAVDQFVYRTAGQAAGYIAGFSIGTSKTLANGSLIFKSD